MKRGHVDGRLRGANAALALNMLSTVFAEIEDIGFFFPQVIDSKLGFISLAMVREMCSCGITGMICLD